MYYLRVVLQKVIVRGWLARYKWALISAARKTIHQSATANCRKRIRQMKDPDLNISAFLHRKMFLQFQSLINVLSEGRIKGANSKKPQAFIAGLLKKRGWTGEKMTQKMSATWSWHQTQKSVVRQKHRQWKIVEKKNKNIELHKNPPPRSACNSYHNDKMSSTVATNGSSSIATTNTGA